MTQYEEFLETVIRDGIAGVMADYATPRDKDKLEGALKGFEECRGKNPKELLELLEQAKAKVWEAQCELVDRYWYWRCREAEIEWVCNVTGTVVGMNGVTAMGVLKAAEVLAKMNGCLSIR